MVRQHFAIDFVVAGPQRTATSWLDHVIRQHRDLRLPRGVKETMFFDERYDKGLDWYAAHFPARSPGMLLGEVGPSYFDVAEVPERIRSLNPRCRITISLREPVSRCHSLYIHHRVKGRVRGTLRQAVEQMPRILESGRYATHIPRWVDAFGQESIHFILQEDCERAPQRVLDDFLEFVGAERIPLPDAAHERVGAARSLPRFPRLARSAARTATWLRSKRLHWVAETAKRFGARKVYGGSRQSLPVLADEDRRWLRREFAADVAYVETLLCRRLAHWT